jgi:hypothetical protein
MNFFRELQYGLRIFFTRMDMDQQVLNNCYDILAVMQFNLERNLLCAEIFRKILLENLQKVNIESLAREVAQKNLDRQRNEKKDAGNTSSSDHFNFLDSSFILNTRLENHEVLEYLQSRFFVYNSLFQEEYPLSIEGFVQIASAIEKIMIDRGKKVGFSFQRYQFGELEFGDIGFVKIPDRKYISKWTRMITFKKQDIIDQLPNKEINLDFFLNNYSFSQRQLQSEPDTRFQEYPLFKIDDDTFILAFPFLLITCLPQKLESFLQQIQNYQGLKGKVFENMALDLFENVLCKNFRKNFVYDPQSGEIDGILEFEERFWLIECKSRPPSLKSLRGDYKVIRSDINKTVNKSEAQFDRALKQIDKLKINPVASRRPGIIVILDGIYPQLNTTSEFHISPTKLKIPRLIINYFDLKEILRQPNSYLFEEFLEWRTEENLPVMCFDEMDYWIFFSKYGFDPKMQKFLKNAVTNKNYIIYRGW